MSEELMNFDIPTENTSIIKVFGVGGGGGNAVNYMYKKGIKDVDFVVCNTDSQALANSPVPIKIQIGSSLTEGRGAGNKPEIGKQAAIENIDDISEVLASHTKMVFITAGMGGGTGTGAAPVIAKQAKEMGILTVAIVTIPFRNEGYRRINQAMEGIAELEQHVDSLLIINNEKIREIHGDLRVSEAFSRADDILAIAAKGIAEIITVHGYINVDFADVETVMNNSGVAIMGSAITEGEDRAIKAVEEALNSPLLNDNDIQGARNILINITSGEEELTMDEIGEITDYIQDCAGQDADLIWGNGFDKSLENKISVTVIATGFSSSSIPELYEKKRSVNKYDLSEKDKVFKQSNPGPSDDRQETFDVKEINGQQKEIEFDLTDDSDESFVLSQENTKHDLQAAKKIDEIKKEHAKLREKSYNNLETTNEIEELENEPAYVRKRIKLNKANQHEKNEISRYSLDEDENNNIRLSPDNPYLHDNVD